MRDNYQMNAMMIIHTSTGHLFFSDTGYLESRSRPEHVCLFCVTV